MHLPRFFESELHLLNKEMLFSFDSPELNGYFNAKYIIDELLNVTERGLCNRRQST